MKTTIALLVLMISSISFAQEITLNEYNQILQDNKSVFEQVSPGMTSLYQEESTIENENGDIEECRHNIKRVVVSTDFQDKYLVYTKSTAVYNCGSESKGDVDEYLSWRKIESGEVTGKFENRTITYSKISKNNNIITLEGFITYHSDGAKENLKVDLDVSKSQFFSLVDGKWNTYSVQLLKRSFTDPASIDLTNLEVVNSIED